MAFSDVEQAVKKLKTRMGAKGVILVVLLENDTFHVVPDMQARPTLQVALLLEAVAAELRKNILKSLNAGR